MLSKPISLHIQAMNLKSYEKEKALYNNNNNNSNNNKKVKLSL
jgi:hypothetical protein